MKNIQVFDRAENATFSIFQATDEEFAALFPSPGQDMEFIEDCKVDIDMSSIWERPILKRDAMGIHGSLFFEFEDRKKYYPATKSDVDWDPSSINQAQRELFAKHR
jgi:hypothetical protein